VCSSSLFLTDVVILLYKTLLQSSDLWICGKVEPIDGTGMILARAGPTVIRPASGLPVAGRMFFDSADVERLKLFGEFDDVIVHEMVSLFAHICGGHCGVTIV